MTNLVPSAGLNFTAVDFETANRSRASVCAVGAVRIRDGIIVDEFHTLVSPPEGYDDFEEGNVGVHGITAEDVASAPGWDSVYPQLMGFIDGDLLVGHNARFDVSVLLNATGVCDLPWPELNTLCTLQLARAALRIPSYSLPWVANHLGLGDFDHHDPLADARMTARVLLALAQLHRTSTVSALVDVLSVPLIPTFVDELDAVASELDSSPDPLIATGFSDQAVCFTGALRIMIRDEARRLVVEHGGLAQSGVNKKTTVLVTGDFDARTFRPGANFSAKLQKAFDLVDDGQALEIITEEDFIARLSLSEEALRNRISRAGTSRRKLPDWVASQSGTGPGEDYWAWFNSALAHPRGRAVGGEACIWCDAPVGRSIHWVHRDRHVCGVHCNERLKRAAARMWEREGFRRPPMDAAWLQ
ncbi:DNA polymerase III PolC-type [Microbacterium oxydans]|uniref:exonuclease domain-containing protein n=1 Tax=Microbacterium oxydans TaxID=82380 RepID=UPI001D96B415|nr:exonuclease domain-containing protein [Microbacterium oxydans]CAH0171693.1 DNA polymerase III PolC-type [Microbacterium oxydans]